MLWSPRTFLLNRNQKKFLVRFLSASKADEIRTADHPLTAGYLSKVLGSTHRHWTAALNKYKELHYVKREDLINSAKTLKSLDYSIDEILKKPMLLYINTLTIQNRYNVLKECGCESISVSILLKFVTVMNKNVSTLKGHGYIPFAFDVEENLRTRFTDIDLYSATKYGEDLKLKTLRMNILNLYLTQRLGMNEKELTKLWKVYSRIRHRSFHSIQQMVEILQNNLQFSHERITKNAFVLYGDPDNVTRMLKEIKTINGQDFREVLYKMPKILMSSTENLVKIINHVKSFNIKEDAILRCLEILTLSPDTVLERLKDLQEVEEFQVLCTNPRVLRLVHYQNKARLRLDYLNQLKVRCASLHVLSCGSVAFARFAREGSDRTKGRDVVIFLANVLNQDENETRAVLSRHPNWCHIPLVQVKQCYEHLITKQFSKEDIYKNLYILLYPINRIEEKFLTIHRPDALQEMNVKEKVEEITSSEMLALILYLIEREFHFTGDGIWTEQHTVQVENFHNILPDFPEGGKAHRYGFKMAKIPAPKSKISSQSLHL